MVHIERVALWLFGFAAAGALAACSGAANDVSCRDNTSCEPGDVCFEGACHGACNLDPDCGAGEVCVDGLCYPGSGNGGSGGTGGGNGGNGGGNGGSGGGNPGTGGTGGTGGGGSGGTAGAGGGGSGGSGGTAGGGGAGGTPIAALVPRLDNTTCYLGGIAGVPPATLSATGCFLDVASRTPAAPLIPFDINAALWSDGAAKERYLVLPTATSTVSVADAGASAGLHWDFPDGTVTIKTFLLPFTGAAGPELRAVETRFLVQRAPGVWEGRSYKWNAGRTDADLLADGEVATYATSEAGGSPPRDHVFPSPAECLVCHNAGAGFALGLRTGQLNRNHAYAAGSANQLDALSAAGVFAEVLPPGVNLPEMPDPSGAGDVALLARSYLHANCSHCHNPASPAAFIDLRYDTPLPDTQLLCVPVNLLLNSSSSPGTVVTGRLVPGDTTRSMLWERLDRRGPGSLQMPPLATLQKDIQAQTLIAAFIVQEVNPSPGCACPVEPVERACSDGIDDDCDGSPDAADGDCAAPVFGVLYADTCGLNAALNGFAVAGGDTVVDGYYVDWGDGAFASVISLPAVHAYAAPGTFAVEVLALQSNGLETPGPLSVTVASGAGPPTINLSPPVITGLQLEVNGGTSPSSLATPVTRISWDWGDGTVEDAWFPNTHVYAVAGTYTVNVVSHQCDFQAAGASLEVILTGL